MSSFKGLWEVVDVWRSLDPEQRRVGAGLSPALADVLERADAYMRAIDGVPAVNEAAPRPSVFDSRDDKGWPGDRAV